MEGISAISTRGLQGTPATRRPFSQRQTEPVFLCYGRNLPGGKGLTEASNFQSIYRLPARAAFGRGPGGEPPLWEGQSTKTPPRIAASKFPSPGGLTYFWLAGKPGRGPCGLAGSPKANGWEATPQTSNASRKVLEVQGGLFLLVGVRGQCPRGKGCGQDPRALCGSLAQGEGPHSKALYLGMFPLQILVILFRYAVIPC